MRRSKIFLFVVEIIMTLVIISILYYGFFAKSVKEINSSKLRIVSLAPNITEILYELELGQNIVGVTKYCNYPEEVKKKDKIGGFIDPDIEKIISLKPTIVIGTKDGNRKEFVEQLIEMNIKVHILPVAKTVKEVPETILELGKLLDVSNRANEIANNINNRIDKIYKLTKNITIDKRKRVLIVFGHDPIQVAGCETFANDMLEISGGVNVIPASLRKYPACNIEEIVTFNPDIIIEASMISNMTKTQKDTIVAYWNKWNVISAIKNNKLFVVNSDLITRPGPRIADGVELLYKLINNED